MDEEFEGNRKSGQWIELQGRIKDALEKILEEGVYDEVLSKYEHSELLAVVFESVDALLDGNDETREITVEQVGKNGKWVY